MKEGKITLSQEQLKTLSVINRFIDKSISRQQAAELLGLSTRQITRLKKGVLSSGAESLIHKNTGRKLLMLFQTKRRKLSLRFIPARNCLGSTSSISKIYS